MAKGIFKDYNLGQISLFPYRLEERIPQESPSRLINQIVDSLDLSLVVST